MTANQQLSVNMFSSEYPPCWGGVGKHVQNICKRLAPHIDLRLTTATYGKPIEKFEINNLARLRLKSFPLLLAQYLSGVKFIRLNGRELVHIHVPHAFLPKTTGRIITTFHVVWPQYSESMYRERSLSLFDLRIAGMNHRLMELEKKLARMSDAVIAVSKNTKNELVSRYGVAADKVHVIHNGVNLSGFRPSTKRRNMFVYVGRQTAHKGIPYLLRGFAEFSQENSDYELVLVGERLEGGVDPSLIRLSRELGLDARVRFTGRLPDRDVSTILGQATCLVLPSLAEAFGMTVLEAMASHTPVIATNVGGIPELVSQGRNGLLVPPADAHALSEAMKRIACDSNLRHRLARGGKLTSEQCTWDKAARMTLEVYGQVLD